MENDIKQWEIWFGNFPLEEDNSKSLPRPIIVVDATSFMVLSVKVTSTDRNNMDEYDVPIIHWKEAGLRNFSIARVSKMMEIGKDAFRFKIGALHEDDIYGIEVTIKCFIENY